MPGLYRRLFPVLATFAALGPGTNADFSAGSVRYRRHKLYELVARADCIVAGEIVRLDGNSFDVAVETRVRGSSVPDPLRVRRFEDWTCASRWTEYAKGQRVLLFLSRPAAKAGAFRILGGGGEGEMPLASDSVVVRGYAVQGFQGLEHEVTGGMCSGPLVPLREIADAIGAFAEAFSWERGKDGWPERLEFRSEQQALLLRDSSPTGRHLFEQVLSSEEWHHAVPEAGFPADAKRLEANPLRLSGLVRLAPGRTPDRFGFQLDSKFGSTCAYLGDVNGDGVDDLAVGARADSYLGRFHGALWVLLMGPGGDVAGTAEISDAAGCMPAMGEWGALGTAVAPLGDLDGDGIPDVAVSARGFDGAALDSGAVWILFLDRSGNPTRSVELGQEAALLAAGVGAEYGLGEALANLGDLDADGFPELAIAQNPDFDTAFKTGHYVLVVSLDREGNARWVQRMHDRDAIGASSRLMFGTALAGLGDVNGDDVPDMAVGDPWDDDGGERRGALWIVMLDAGGAPRGVQKISDWQGGFGGLLRDDEQFGRSLASPGDLDGDGVPDLVVGRVSGVSVLFLMPDGTVKRHADALVSRDADPDYPEIGTSLACGRQRPDQAGSIRLVVGGAVEQADDEPDGAVWLLQLHPDGSLSGE